VLVEENLRGKTTRLLGILSSATGPNFRVMNLRYVGLKMAIVLVHECQ